jgi:hypothetical protein
MTQEKPPIVEIRVRADSIGRYTAIFQPGVTLITSGTVSIGVFLNSLPGFTVDYINSRVQTIFLNGSAVDDLETPLTGVQPVLAISAAMPGLAGAIFRRNSMHAALRSASVQDPVPSEHPETFSVTLKLFNMIAAEKGPGLLARGVGFTGTQLSDFFTDHPALLTSTTRAFIDGRKLDREELRQGLDTLDTIDLIIRTDKIDG